MKRMGWLALLAACLAASGCAGTAARHAAPAAEAPAPETAEETTQGTDESAGTQEAGEAPSGAGTAEPAPSGEAETPPAAEKDYYMDKNYILRPKDDADPKKVVLLTFDDGPKEREQLTSMLDTLDRHEAKAIFFVNGYRAEQQPELVKLIRERGQTIGNHSWDHIDLKKESQAEMERQIDDVQKLVTELTGEAPKFFRPPFGSGGDEVRAKAKESGMLYMTWSNGSRDWMSGYDEPQKVIDSVLEQLHPGSNILMHELPWTAEALDGLLSALREREYTFLDPARIDPDYSKN